MRIWRSIVVCGFVLAGTLGAQAGSTACPEHYHTGVAPDFYIESLVRDAAELCYTAFGVVHSGVAAIPLFSAEHLTKQEVFAAKGIDRVNRFRAEGRLPARHRAELYHYKGSGYDRGHLAPSKNMPTHEAMLESFTLANMVPQWPELNRGTWVAIEATTRALAVSYDEVYIVTGVSFLESTMLKRIGGRITVPTSVFKAVYIPSQNAAAAWYATNAAPGDEFELISIETLKGRVGFDPFPAVAPEVKAIAAGFPAPSRGYDRQIAAAMDPNANYAVEHRPRENTTGVSHQSEARVSFLKELIAVVRELVMQTISDVVRWLKSLI